MEGPVNNQETAISLEGDNWILPTVLEVLDPAEEALTNRMQAAGWSEDDIFHMELAVHEALVNALIHGNLGIIKPDNSEKNIGELAQEELERNPNKKNKKVKIKLSIDEKRIYIRITDEGKGFFVHEVPDPTDPSKLMRTKGRGLLIMEEAFDSVEFRGPGNEVVLIKEKKV